MKVRLLKSLRCAESLLTFLICPVEKCGCTAKVDRVVMIHLCGMGKRISGIQQVGIGIPDVHKAWKWYRNAFGIDIRMFEEAAEAALMTRYTGGEVHARHAALALHMGGGAGMEIWQFTSREPQPAPFEGQLGDTGIFICKVKCVDADAMHAEHARRGIASLGPVHTRPDGSKHFYLKDPHGYFFEVVESNEWFGPAPYGGGVGGAVLGVSDVEKSLKLYRDVLGYDHVVMDETRFIRHLRRFPAEAKPTAASSSSVPNPQKGHSVNCLAGEKSNSSKPWTARLATCLKVDFGETLGSSTFAGTFGT